MASRKKRPFTHFVSGSQVFIYRCMCSVLSSFSGPGDSVGPEIQITKASVLQLFLPESVLAKGWQCFSARVILPPQSRPKNVFSGWVSKCSMMLEAITSGSCRTGEKRYLLCLSSHGHLLWDYKLSLSFSEAHLWCCAVLLWAYIVAVPNLFETRDPLNRRQFFRGLGWV